MFSAVGLFKNIPCPRVSECSLPSCIFSHLELTVDDATKTAKEYDPFSAGEPSSPPAKRRRLALHKTQDEDDDCMPHNPSPVVEVQIKKLPEERSPARQIPKPPPKQDARQTDGPLLTAPKPQTKDSPASVKRVVSPPPMRKNQVSRQPPLRREVKVESLTPRNVAKAPAVLKTRLSVLQALHKQVQEQNRKLASAQDKWKPFVLNQQEMISFALDEEETATKLGEAIYRNAMAQKILRIKKMSSEDWLATVRNWIGLGPTGKNDDVTSTNGTLDTAARKLSETEEIAILQRLRTPLEGLEGFGYVTQKPSAAEIASASAATASAAGFEKCDRCSTRFQVFPGRDERGRLTSHGKCYYHWARPNRAAGARTDKIIGRSESSFPCCNQLEGSEGCTEADTHVFNVKHPPQLASILQFEQTPHPPGDPPSTPISFDCEMGYTTFGMEVIRLTAVTWPSAKVVLDILVRPYGEILDLNTRFSGVTKEAYANAEDYESGSDSPTATLRKVGSPAAARQLLFERLSPNTPLLGHAIDNDLNVCRIIHPFVVDTVLLYPHPRGLPIRFSLKVLAQKYLSRGIQKGGEAGHDSNEDAVATGDLVRHKVAETWANLYHAGWRFADGVLKDPEEAQMNSKTPAML